MGMGKLERQEIGDLLHDEVLQDFAVCQMKIQLCRKHMDAGRYEEAAKELPRAEAAVEVAIKKTRTAIAKLKDSPVTRNIA
jgi:signal transduction histidine kinase